MDIILYFFTFNIEISDEQANGILSVNDVFNLFHLEGRKIWL